MLTLLLALTAAWAAPSDDTLDVRADRLVVEEDVATGEGNVRLQLGPDLVEGERIEADLEARTAVIHNGRWHRAGLGLLVFERAEVDLDAGTGVVHGARFEAEDRSVDVQGATLSIEADGSVRGHRVTFSPCACDGIEPWSVSARRVKLVPGEKVQFTGGAFRIFDIPLIPVPGGEIPLSRRSGFLLPLIGYGEQGFFAAVPLYLTLGASADLTLTPEVRTKQGVRTLADLRYALRGGEGRVAGALGYDFPAKGARGGLLWDHRWGQGLWSTHAHTELPGDLGYAADYGDSFLARRVPWYNSRALLSYGAVELSTEMFRLDQSVWQEVGSLGVYRPAVDVGGGVLVQGQGRVHTLIEGSGPWQMGGQATLIGRASVQAERPFYAGPLLINPQLRADVEGMSGDAALFDELSGRLAGSAAVDVRLPLWHAGSKAFQRLEPLIEARGTVQHGELVATPRTSAELSPWDVRGGLLYRWTRTEGGSFEARATAGRRADGWQTSLRSAVQVGRWWGWVQIDSPLGRARDDGGTSWLDVGSTGLAWDDGRFRVEGRWIYTAGDLLWSSTGAVVDDLHQVGGGVRWRLPALQSTLTVRGGLGWDLVNQALASPYVGLSYTHPTGCLTLGLTARWDPDRAVPDFGTQFELKPGKRVQGAVR